MSDWLFGTSPAREPWNTLSPWARRWWETESGRAWRLLWGEIVRGDTAWPPLAPTWHDIHQPKVPA